MRISDWSSDVCSSDLRMLPAGDSFRRAAGEGASLIAIDAVLAHGGGGFVADLVAQTAAAIPGVPLIVLGDESDPASVLRAVRAGARDVIGRSEAVVNLRVQIARHFLLAAPGPGTGRSEEHTSELQSLMRISYAVFCLKKKNTPTT